MAKLLVALGDEKQFTKLSEEERLSFTNRLESEINAFYERDQESRTISN
jgi:hypothetical protein